MRRRIEGSIRFKFPVEIIVDKSPGDAFLPFSPSPPPFRTVVSPSLPPLPPAARAHHIALSRR